MGNASHATRASDQRREDGLSRHGLAAAKVARLGQVRVDLKTWEISLQGHRSRLQEKPFRVLVALIERPGELITRSELRERLWPDGTIVDFDNNLNSAVATLRMALGDTAKAPRIIETLPRLGYRLIAEVSLGDSEPLEEPPGSGVVVTEPGRFGPRWIAAAAFVVLVMLAAVVRERPGAPVNRPSEAATLEPPSSEVAAPDDPEARQAWHNGLYLLARASAGDLALALESFEKARRREPRFAPAHARAAETLMRMSFARDLELRQGLTRAREAAGRALSLDPASATAHRIRALADLHLDWDFESAGRELESALRLDLKDAQNYLAAATFLSAAGGGDAAVLAARRAVELDPASSLLQADLGYFLMAGGRYAEALTLCEDLLELEPDSIHVLAFYLLAAERLGRFAQSLASAQRIMELLGAEEAEIRSVARGEARAGLIRFRKWRLAALRASGEPSYFRLALRQAPLHKESALASLQQAYERREPWLVYLQSDARLDGLREDPRFLAFVRKLGFPQPSDAVVARVEKLL